MALRSSSLSVSPRVFRSLAFVGLLTAASVTFGQSPIIPLPNTVTTVAGGGATSTGTATAPVACYTGSLLKSYDVNGNGCPGAYVNFSNDLRGGLASDGAGNIYIGDTTNQQLRMYDPRTGIVSRVAGKGTACGNITAPINPALPSQLDSQGDGCPSQQTVLNNLRGIATDSYGNVFIAGYNSNLIHIVCKTASPLCPNTDAGHKQVGYMYRIAGCVASNNSSGTAAPTANTVLNTWAGTEGDGSFASPYGNLSGEAADGITGAATYGACPGTNTNSGVGVLNQPRGVAADRFGNVYIAETGTTGAGLRFRVVLGPKNSTYFSGDNPMWAIINSAVNFTSTAGTFTYTAHQGYIYTILGGFSGTPSAKGNACGSYFAEDARGDGCPFYYSSASGGQQGVAVDDSGNVYFSDISSATLRVLYTGGANNPIQGAIVSNSFGTVTTGSLAAGNVYLLAGGGGNTPATAPALGNTLSIQSDNNRLNVGPGGNIYLGESASAQVFLYDVHTGYLKLLFKSGTPCAAHIGSSTNGEGCPSGGFSVSGANAFGVAVDPIGNVYVADSTNSLIRKVEATSLVPITLGATRADGSANVQTFVFHGQNGMTSMTFTALDQAADFTLGTSTCSAVYADNSIDCSIPITFTPTLPGPRTIHLSVQGYNGSTWVAGKVMPISGVAYGSALMTDVASPNVDGSTGSVLYGAALDGTDNFYTVYPSNNSLLKVPLATGTPVPIGTVTGVPSGIATDASGDVFVFFASTGSITKYALNPDGTYTASTQTLTGIAPSAAVADASGNAYVTDANTKSLLLIPAGTDFNTQQGPSVIASGFTNPVGIAMDGQGNLFVADPGASAVYKVANINGVFTKSVYVGTGGVITTPVTPASIAADAAGNVYVQDTGTQSILMYPANQTGPASVTVLTGIVTPTGLAVDGSGNVYSTEAGAGRLTLIKRNAATFDFGTSTALTFAGTITNAGNISATGHQTVGLDLGDFPITSVSPSNCFNTAPILPGYACSVTSQFTPGTGSGAVSSTIGYTVATSTVGNLMLTGTKNGTAITTSTTIGTPSTASPVYSASGTEVSFPVTVTASDSSTPSGSITVSIDSGSAVGYTLSGGTVTVNVSGLSAGGHTISAAYPTQGGVTGSSSSVVNFSIARATTQVNWTPGASTTQPYSTPIGNSILDASGVIAGTSSIVPGYYQYLATPTSGTPVRVHAASYLPIGTYTLSVIFSPYDNNDYTISQLDLASSYTVVKADTSAPIGSTQMLVAADGTGNYASIQAAVNATSAGGGSIYIKPGTYTENVAIVQPNVALRGLGGDPTQVVLTHQAGAFGGSGVYLYAGEFTTSQTNGYQLPAGSTQFSGDEGSATLVVAKGVNTAVSSSQLTPNGFYAENLSLVNTYDSDTTKTTTTYLPSSNSGTCAANQGPARTYNDLFNAGQLCASQALAIWITSDLAVMNNVYTTSLQDTIYAGSQGAGSNGYVPSREYWFRGKVTGTVDYIFGDAAAVFDYSSIYTVPHGTGIAGTATIEAQNKAVQTGSANDYLSGYVMNSNVFTSYQNGQTGLYFGRPYGAYSTWIMLNSYVDQVNPLGYFEFASNTNNLPTSTYAEFNDMTYTDPATGSPDLNGVIYQGVGGASGAGVTGTRETVSQNPGTLLASNLPKTSMTATQATLYYPMAFLGSTVPGTVSSTQNWNPMAAIAAGVNGFVPSTSVTAPAYGQSFTLLMRPQTPGLGAITNGTYTIPTGTYTLYDNGTQIATGTLDAAGEAYYISSNLSVGAHSFTWTYSGDANFNGSSTSTALAVTVGATATTTTMVLPSGTVTYGDTGTFSVTVAAQGSSYKPTSGTILLYRDGSLIASSNLDPSGTTQIMALVGTAGSHTFQAVYQSNSSNVSNSSTLGMPLTINKATLTITGVGTDRVFGTANVLGHNTGGYVSGDSASNVFDSGPSQTTTATRLSPAGNYAVTPTYTLSTFGAANYTVTAVNGSFNVTGGAAQTVIFAPLPDFPSGSSYQLSARASSGLPVTYTITQGGGYASISGSTLTVTGPGPVTVMATQTDASGNYATASSSRSFTAQ